MKTKEWYVRQKKDPYVKKAIKQGFVSRSAYKLIEIDNKYKLLKKSNSILELGASPGGWTQVILRFKAGQIFKLVCVDKISLSFPLYNDYFFIKGNFYDKLIINKIKEKNNNGFDLILSDMAPNATGSSSLDHLKIIQMSEDILTIIKSLLKNNGNLIIKIYQGEIEKNLILQLRKKFKSVYYFKPKSSRKESSEIYLISLQYK